MLSIFHRTQTYNLFLQSRLGFQKNIVKWMRISFFLVAVPILFVIMPFGRPLGLFIIIGTPINLTFHFLLSTLFLRKRFQRFCPYFINIEILAFLSMTIEAVIKYFEENMIFGMLVGFDMAFLFSLLLVSKLPTRNLIISFSIFSVHFLWRAFSYNISWVTGLFYLALGIVLLFIYWRQEKKDFQLFSDLNRKEKSLLNFKQLIQNFPNQIIILNEEGYEKDLPIFVNEEAEKLFKNINMKNFFQILTLEEIGPHEDSRNNLPSVNLATKIKGFFQMKEKSNKFSHYISTFMKGTEQQENSNIFKSSINNNDKDKPSVISAISKYSKEDDYLVENPDANSKYLEINEKYETLIGKIEWGEKNNEDTLIIILNDVSKREQIRELKLLHMNKDRLLATVSHELRTPLNGIIGMLDIVDEKIEDKKLRKYLSIAKNSAKTLLLMIGDILDTYQIQKGELKLNLENININETIDQVIPLMSVQIKKKGLMLNYINKCDSSLFVRADKNRLKQIIFNLLSNAYKFTETGEISVEVYPTLDEENKQANKRDPSLGKLEENYNLKDEEESVPGFDEITIKVVDTGRGIKPENLSQLFKLFGKFELSGNETGVGLGLAISQRLAKQMSHEGIQVNSEYGKGSQFWINLQRVGNFRRSRQVDRLSFNPSKKKGVLQQMVEKEQVIHHFKRLLVVDDDQVNQKVIGKYLSEIGSLLFDRVFNGAEAIESIKKCALKNQFYDLILMDCNMPIMDGFQATKNLRDMIQKGEIPEVKIVAITANVSVSDRTHCLKSGMEDVLPKPIHKDEFQRKIKTLLNIKS